MTIKDEDVRVVLVRPRNPLNIGAAARAMMNFGFEDLVLVSPHEPVWQESKAAVGAEPVLRRARAVPELLGAVEDRTLVIGTSSLARRRISQPVVSLEHLGSILKGRKRSRIALVFGSEKTGLSNEHLSYCHWIVRIPTTAACPSMNLGQAVAVCCYELRRLLNSGAAPGKKSLIRAATLRERVMAQSAPYASVSEIERLIAAIENLVSTTSREAIAAKSHKTHLRQMLRRWPVSSKDITLVLGILRALSWQVQQRKA